MDFFVCSRSHLKLSVKFKSQFFICSLKGLNNNVTFFALWCRKWDVLSTLGGNFNFCTALGINFSAGPLCHFHQPGPKYLSHFPPIVISWLRCDTALLMQSIRGLSKFMGYTGWVQFENWSHKQVPALCIIAEKSVSPVEMINEKSTDPVQKLYAESTNSIGYRSFLQSGGVLG